MSWSGIGSAVANIGGSGTVKDNDTSGSIKTAFGSLLLNLGSAAGGIGLEALAKKVGGTGQQFIATGRALTATPGEVQRQREIASPTIPNYVPALIVGVAGTVAVLAFLALRKKRAG